MSSRATEHAYTILALRKKREIIGQVVYDKAMSIALSVDKMLKNEGLTQEQQNHLRDIEEASAAIRATLQEIQ